MKSPATACVLMIVVASLSTPAALADAVPGSVRQLACTAHMSNPRPTHNSTTYVDVRTVKGAHVHTVAHYKSTDSVRNAQADRHGDADLGYDISDATIGYRVHVSVSVQAGDRSGSCSTSFVPRA